MDTIATRVSAALIRELGVGPGTVFPTSTLAADLNMDSLDRVSFQLALEDEFSIFIEEDEAEACTTVADVVALVERKVAAQDVLGKT